MVAERQEAINIVNDGLQTLPIDKVLAIRDYVTTLTQEKTTTYKKREYIPNPKYTEATRAERMRRFRMSAGTIDVDEIAIREMRERSMI